MHDEMSTDEEWEKWGAKDPYFGVITDPKYRQAHLNEDHRAEFFRSGEVHAQYVLDRAKRMFGLEIPRKVLDFGCGVGRVLLPFANIADHVTGVDVSSAMLTEAQRNCTLVGATNVQLIAAGNLKSFVPGSFDLVHSAIVLQHISVNRGLDIFRSLVDLVAPYGVGAIQLTYSKEAYSATEGMQPVPVVPKRLSTIGSLNRYTRSFAATSESAAAADPEMIMTSYPLTSVFFILQSLGVLEIHADFTNHGGELGVFIFFRGESRTES
jgi:SAM-dependent methyltransferase